MIPASYQPVSTMVIFRALVRSAVGPQAALASARTNVSRARTRISAYLSSVDLHFDLVECLFAGDSTGEEIGEVRPLQPDETRPRVAVRRREPRPILVALRRDRQPFVRTDAQRAAVRQHRILQRGHHLGAIRGAGIREDRIVGCPRGGLS